MKIVSSLSTSTALLLLSTTLSSRSTSNAFSVPSSGLHTKSRLQVSSGTISEQPPFEDASSQPDANKEEADVPTAIMKEDNAPKEQLIDSVVPKKSGRHALPSWGRMVNDGLGMKLVTHADKKHLHAITGSAWYFGGYALLASAWFREIAYNDWSAFAHFDGILPVACLGAIGCALASSPLRHEKRFPRYSDMMRNGMASGALTATLSAAYAMDPAVMADPTVHAVTQGVVGSAMAVLAYMSVADKMPWNIEDLIRELKLEMPPVLILRLGRLIAFAWMAVLATNASHVFVTGDNMLSDETSRAFLAQIAFSLSMAPSGDALAGSLMKTDRFANTTGKHRVIKKGADGKYSTSRAFEFVQLALNDPGPFLITMVIAICTNHADVVSQFFYLS